MCDIFIPESTSLCRICLKPASDMDNLFEGELANMLNIGQFMEVSENDGLPAQICGICEQELEQSYAFKLKCSVSQRILNMWLQDEIASPITATNTVKDEIVIEDEGLQLIQEQPLDVDSNITIDVEKELLGEDKCLLQECISNMKNKSINDTPEKFWSGKRLQNGAYNHPIQPVTNNIIILENRILVPEITEVSVIDIDNVIGSVGLPPSLPNIYETVDEPTENRIMTRSAYKKNIYKKKNLTTEQSSPKITLPEDDTCGENIIELKNVKDDGIISSDDVKNIMRTVCQNIQENPTNLDNLNKNIYKRKTDYCYFCKLEVPNFGRHMLRNHSTELEVIQISSTPAKSRERKRLFDLLRRKSNYLKSSNESVKPVRQSSVPNQSVLPCNNCLGFFSAKVLYRHRKKCAQTARIDQRLRQEVFPSMRPDEVFLEGKKDEEMSFEDSKPIQMKAIQKIVRIPWTTEQKHIVKSFFKTHIEIKKPPIKAECEHLIRKYPQQLHNKNWLKIKVFIQNEYTRKKKNRDGQFNMDMDMKEDLIKENSRAEKPCKEEITYDDSLAKPRRKLIPWTTKQKHIVKNFFKTHIKNKVSPRKAECEDLISQYPQQLHNKNWKKIRVFIQNEYNKKNRDDDSY